MKIKIVKESLIFKKSDIGLNMDDFNSGKADRLFITGVSGSGKSTLSQEITKKNPNAVHIKLDRIARKLKAEHGDEVFSNNLDPKFVSDKFIEEIEKEVQNNPGKTVIFDGVQVPKIDMEYLKKYPLYSLNTPTIKSFVMGRIRDHKKGKPLNLIYNFKENLKRDKRMQKFNTIMSDLGAQNYDLQKLLGMTQKEYLKSIKNLKESELSDDLKAMYGNALKLKNEDLKSYEDAKKYLIESALVNLNESVDKYKAEKIVKESILEYYLNEGNLFDNIRKKRKRIERGSKERMKKPSEEGYPHHLERIAKEAAKDGK